MDRSRLLTPEEVSQLLRVDKHTVYNWIRKRKLRAFKVGNQWRINREDLPQGYIQDEDQSIQRNQGRQAPVPHL